MPWSIRLNGSPMSLCKVRQKSNLLLQKPNKLPMGVISLPLLFGSGSRNWDTSLGYQSEMPSDLFFLCFFFYKTTGPLYWFLYGVHKGISFGPGPTPLFAVDIHRPTHYSAAVIPRVEIFGDQHNMNAVIFLNWVNKIVGD